VAITCSLLLRDEAPGDWRFPKSLLLTKYHSGQQIKKDKMGGICGMYGDRKGAHRALVEKPQRKRPLA